MAVRSNTSYRLLRQRLACEHNFCVIKEIRRKLTWRNLGNVFWPFVPGASLFWPLCRHHDQKWELEHRSAAESKALPSALIGAPADGTSSCQSIAHTTFLSLMNKIPRFFLYLGEQFLVNPMGASQYIPAEDDVFSLRGADFCPSHVISKLPGRFFLVKKLGSVLWCWNFTESSQSYLHCENCTIITLTVLAGLKKTSGRCSGFQTCTRLLLVMTWCPLWTQNTDGGGFHQSLG